MTDRRSYDDSSRGRGGESRERERDRGDDRSGRDRGGRDDRRDSRDSRDDRDRSGRDRDDRGGRDRNDDRGGSRGSSYTYQARDPAALREREDGGSDFDRILKPGAKMWKPNDRDNRIRILPPTWEKPGHYGYDIHVHYGVGADRQTYLDLFKMLDKPDPINDAREKFARAMDTEDQRDKDYLKELSSKKRVLVWLIDRDNERDGVQAWAMPKGVDDDIVSVCRDKATGEVLAIDDPENGYDVEFTKKGAGIKTEYTGISIARRSTPLGKAEWMDYAVDHPLPDMLNYYDYDHIARAFGGGGAHRGGDDRGGDGRDSRDGRDTRNDDRRGGDDRGRDSRDDRGGSRGGDDRGGTRREEPVLTWASVHEMRPRELEDLIEEEKLGIDPREAKDDEDLADWVCETLKLAKEETRDSGRRAVVSSTAEDDRRLAEMRNRRERG